MWVCAAQQGRDFEAPDLELSGVSISEAFSRTGYNISNARKLRFCKQPLKVFKDRLPLKIRFNALTSKPLYSCCTLERSIKNWPISRTRCQF